MQVVHLALFWLINPYNIQLTHGAAGCFVAQPVGATAQDAVFQSENCLRVDATAIGPG